MSMMAKLEIRGDDMFVRYEYPFSDEPKKRTLWWKIVRITRAAGAVAAFPTDGDVLRNEGLSGWNGPSYTAWTAVNAEAVRVEVTDIPCPPARGRQTRWHDGRWEKLMARGWVPA